MRALGSEEIRRVATGGGYAYTCSRPRSGNSYTDTVAATKPHVTDDVDLTCQHTNRTVLVEGPEIMIRPVGTRRVVPGGSLRSTT